MSGGFGRHFGRPSSSTHATRASPFYPGLSSARAARALGAVAAPAGLRAGAHDSHSHCVGVRWRTSHVEAAGSAQGYSAAALPDPEVAHGQGDGHGGGGEALDEAPSGQRACNKHTFTLRFDLIHLIPLPAFGRSGEGEGGNCTGRDCGTPRPCRQ